MLPARAILFVLFIIFAITLIIGSLLMLSDLEQIQLQGNLWEQRILNNLKSGEAIVQSSTETIEKQTIDLFNAEMDSVTIEKTWWGLFQVGTVEAFKTFPEQQIAYRKAIMYGSQLKREQQAALYLRDNNQPLALAGKTIIKGDVFLPRAGAKRAYINGQGFSEMQLFEGKQQQSKRYIPKLNETPFLPIIKYLVKGFPNSNARLSDTLRQPFYENTTIIHDNIIYLDKQYIKGKVMLMADSLVYISPNSYLENVIIIAPYILIDKGFKGQIQAFASKFIRVGKGVTLTYPSITMVLKTAETPTITQNIIVEKNAIIHGLVGVYQFNKTDLPSIPSLALQENTTVIGQVYSNEKLYLQGNIFGNVTCAGFRVQAAASIYDNHLFNTTIDYSKRPNTYFSPTFLEKTNANEVIYKLD
jgi:hypothetical protein